MQIVITLGQKILVIGTETDDIEKEIYSNSTIEEGRYPRENKHSIDPIKTILAKKYLEEIETQERPSTRNFSLIRKKIDLHGSKDKTDAKKLLEGLASQNTKKECPNCIEPSSATSKKQQPLQLIGDKQYF